jgi:hypothetical protein
MKKLLWLLLIPALSFGQSTTRSTMFKLPLWGTGDTLKAGSKTDSSQSSFSLNNGFLRLDYFMGLEHNGAGYHTAVTSPANTNLIINAGVGTQNKVSIAGSDTLSVGGLSYLANTEVTGTLKVSGTTTGGYGIYQDSVLVGAPTALAGVIRLSNGTETQYGRITLGALNQVNTTYTLPDTAGTFAMLVGNDSVQAPNIHSYIFTEDLVADTTLAGTASAYTEWKAYAATAKVKIRTSYVHRNGVKQVKAYFVIRMGVGGSEAVASLAVGAGSSSAASSSVTYASSSITVPVATFTSGTIYALTFSINGTEATDSCFVKQLSIIAESQ